MSRLTVLGSCGGWPEPGRACSGHLLELAGRRIVLDLGTGTAARLFGLLGAGVAPDAVVVTHAHPDHAVDLHALFRALHYTGGGNVPVLAAPGVAELMAALDPGDARELASVLEFRPLPAAAYRIGTVLVESVALPHYVPNAGVRLSAAGLTVAYTGDTGFDPALITLAREADLLVADSTTRPGGSAGLNLTARQAGVVAAEAGVRRLLLTHFWPGVDRESCRDAAAAVFGGEILVADEGLVVELG